MPASDPDLTHVADTAMYRAKGRGKDCWAHLSPAGTLSTGDGARTG
jgi:hypothetical protein